MLADRIRTYEETLESSRLLAEIGPLVSSQDSAPRELETTNCVRHARLRPKKRDGSRAPGLGHLTCRREGGWARRMDEQPAGQPGLDGWPRSWGPLAVDRPAPAQWSAASGRPSCTLGNGLPQAAGPPGVVGMGKYSRMSCTLFPKTMGVVDWLGCFCMNRLDGVIKSTCPRTFNSGKRV